MAQIRQVVSESLQATIRRLLPSQQGFTEDLQATNVITPIIDLTPTAEGDLLPTDLARAVNYGGATAFSIENGSSADIITNTGFYRLIGTATLSSSSSSTRAVQFNMTDGVTNKTIWSLDTEQVGGGHYTTQYDFIVFMATGITLSGFASSIGALNGSFRQVADINGNIVQPSGFTGS